MMRAVTLGVYVLLNSYSTAMAEKRKENDFKTTQLHGIKCQMLKSYSIHG